MKKLFFYTAAVALCPMFAFGVQQTITGQISDSMCRSNHAMMQKGAAKMNEKDCTAACVKSGQKYVLVTKDKVYQITNQNYAGLAANAGGAVTVTGDVSADGASINIAKMNPAK